MLVAAAATEVRVVALVVAVAAIAQTVIVAVQDRLPAQYLGVVQVVAVAVLQ